MRWKPFGQLMQFSNWHRLCLALLGGEESEAVELIEGSELDERGFIRFLRAQHLAGTIAMVVKDTPVVQLFSPFLLEQLEKAADIQQHHNALVLATLLQVSQGLEAQGIPVIHLKGCYYAHRFWGGLDRRFLWDLDLMIPDQEFERTVDYMRSLGYRPRSGSLINNRLARKLTHAITLEGDGPEVDLHRVFRVRPAYRIDYDDIWATATEYTLKNKSIQVLSDDYDLLFLLLAVAHDIEVGKVKLKLLFDAKAALETADPLCDWAGFLSRRETERLDKICVNVLVLIIRTMELDSSLPRLSSHLSNLTEVLETNDLAKMHRLLSNPRHSLENRLWFASNSPAGRLPYLLWWSATLPFRFAIGRKL
jgi:hypothetical protein